MEGLIRQIKRFTSSSLLQERVAVVVATSIFALASLLLVRLATDYLFFALQSTDIKHAISENRNLRKTVGISNSKEDQAFFVIKILEADYYSHHWQEQSTIVCDDTSADAVLAVSEKAWRKTYVGRTATFAPHIGMIVTIFVPPLSSTIYLHNPQVQQWNHLKDDSYHSDTASDTSSANGAPDYGSESEKDESITGKLCKYSRYLQIKEASKECLHYPRNTFSGYSEYEKEVCKKWEDSLSKSVEYERQCYFDILYNYIYCSKIFCFTISLLFGGLFCITVTNKLTWLIQDKILQEEDEN